MCVCLDRIVLSRKSESIESNWEQYIVSLHSSLSGKYLDTGVCFDMANVHSGTAWVRELYKAVKFRFITSVNSFKSLLLFPFFLPFRLDFFKIVFHLWFLHIKSFIILIQHSPFVNEKPPVLPPEADYLPHG